jgi:hypothetical protein
VNAEDGIVPTSWGHLVEATDARVVFEPQRAVPPTAWAFVGVVVMLLAPLAALEWPTESVGPGILLGSLVPAIASSYLWFYLPRIALAWTRIRPIRGRLVVQRTPTEAARPGNAAVYRSEARGGATFAATCGGETIGPDRRRGLIQIRAYSEPPPREESPTSIESSLIPRRSMLVANVLLIGDQVLNVSHSFLSSLFSTSVDYDRVSEALARGDGAVVSGRAHGVPGEMTPLVRALIRVFDLGQRPGSTVSTETWKVVLRGPNVWPIAILQCLARFALFAVAVAHGRNWLAFEVPLVLVEAALYVLVLRRRFVNPLDAWLATALGEHSRA